MPVSIERIEYSEDGSAVVSFVLAVSDCDSVTRASVRVGPDRASLGRALKDAQTLLRSSLDIYRRSAEDGVLIAPTFVGDGSVRVASIRRIDQSHVYVDFAVRSTVEGVSAMVFTVPVQDLAMHEHRVHGVVESARETLCVELEHIRERLNGRPAMLHDPEIDPPGMGHGI